jgi:hypothetical protein
MPQTAEDKLDKALDVLTRLQIDMGTLLMKTQITDQDIAKLQARHDQDILKVHRQYDDMAQKVGELEAFRWKLVGMGVAVGAVSSAVITQLFGK